MSVSFHHFRLSLIGCLTCCQLFAGPPVITHDPPASVTADQSLRVVARVRVENDRLKSVMLHVSQSGDTAPIDVPMNAAGAGVYYGNVSPQLFAGASSFKYYIDAHTTSGEWSETDWIRVQVIGGAATDSGAEKESSLTRPLLIIGGGVAVVAAGFALSDSGGSSGGSGGSSDGDAGDVADQVMTRSASDRVNSAAPSLPSVTTLEADSELGGRTIDRVRVRLEFDGIDEAVETYEVTYGGSTVISGSTGTAKTEQVDVVGTDSTTVLIRVLSSLPGADGKSQYSWNATVTYFLSP